MEPISERVSQPTPAEVRLARKRAKLTMAESAVLVSPAKSFPYRTWQSYEVAKGNSGHRAIPLATWELFLLMTDQHPRMRITHRK